MTVLTDILVGNALSAAVLAVLVFAATRIWRNPHVGHALWLLVLLKLVVPPLLEVPVFRDGPAEGEQLASRVDARSVAPRPIRQPVQGPRSQENEEAPSTVQAARQYIASRAETSKLSSPPSHPEADDGAAAAAARLGPRDWARIVWLAGSVMVALVVAWRVVRFGRAVREMLPASTRLQALADELASRLRLGRRPVVRLTAADLAPLVWCGFLRPTIVLPAGLATELSEGEIRTILVHELAHLARRDHWTRWLEVVVTVLYWWHPAVWLARREIRRCEDVCCDAYVLRLLPDSERTYAEAMLRTATLPVRRRSSLPALASSFGTAGSVKRRIEMILIDRPVLGFTKRARCSLLAVAIAVLMLTAGVAEVERPADSDGQAGAADAHSAEQSGAWPLRLVAVDIQTGKPVPSPKFVVRVGGGHYRSGRGDENGEWSVEIPSRTPRYCQIDVKAGTYTPMRVSWSNRDGRPLDELPKVVSFPMAQGIEVGGRVVDEDGEPVAGATVRFSASSERYNRGRRVEQIFGKQDYETDGDGRWVCPIAPKEIDSASISVSHPDYAQDSLTYGIREQIDELRRLEYSFTVSKGFILKGRVINWDGWPIEGVTLGIGELNVYRDQGPFATTDAEGRYEFPPLARHFSNDDDWPVTVTALKPRYAPAMQAVPNSGGKQLRAIESRERVVDFMLREGETVTLLVTDSDGVPLEGAVVYPTLWRDTDALIALRQFGMPERTDALGQWKWTSAPADEVLYDVEMSGFMRLRQQPIRPSDEIIHLILNRPQVIRGKVVDAETKKPIASFFVQKGWPGVYPAPRDGIYWDGMRTQGVDGEYTKRITMPAEAYHYRATAEGYEPEVSELIPVKEGATTLDFELRRADQ